MDKISTSLLGDQYYDNTPRQYVAPPIEARQKLMESKEQDYLLARKTENELDKLVRTLPYLQQSSSIYQGLKDKMKAGLSGVNADNYEDKLLDVDQLANDVVNKFGGNELKQEAELMQAENAKIDAKQKEGKIVDTGMAEWYKQQLNQQHKGLSVDENGVISRPSVKGIETADFVDIQKNLDDIMKGWAANNSVVRNPDGTIKVSNDIRGMLNFSENESVSEEELLRGAMNYMKNDPKTQAYLNDKSRFETRNVTPTAENVSSYLTPDMRKTLLDNPTATVEDIQIAIDNGVINPSTIIQEGTKARLMQNNALVPMDKYGYNKESIKTMADTLLLDSLKAEQAIRMKTVENKPVAETAVVTLEPFITQQEVNPRDIVALQASKSTLSKDRTTLQAQVRDNTTALRNKQEGVTQEGVDELNRKLGVVDAQIAEITSQEKSLNKTLFQQAKLAGHNFEADYQINYNQNRQAAIESNIRMLKNTTAAININDLVKVEKGNPRLVIGGRNYSSMVRLVNGEYVINANKLSAIDLQEVTKNKFAPNGGINSNFIMTKEDQEKFTKVPNREKYGEMLVDAYNDGTSSTNMLGINKNSFQSKDGKYTLRPQVLQTLDKVRTERGKFPWTISTPLTYLSVTGASSKEDVKAMVSYEANKNASFKRSPSQYKIRTVDGIVDLGDYLRTNYDIPSLDPKYIDWDKSEIRTMVESDRKYGQKSGMTIVLTKEGKEVMKNEQDYNESNAIKLTAVNPFKNTPEGKDEIRRIIARGYKSIKGNDSTHNNNLKNDMGISYMNTVPEGSGLDSLNLYTMSPGEKKPWNVRGTNYMISTTQKDVSGNQEELNNLNFHVSKDGYVYGVQNEGKSTERKGWFKESEIDKDPTTHRVDFDSPADIKGVFGATLLDADTQAEVPQQLPRSNVYSEYIKMGYKTPANGSGVISKGYKGVINTMQSIYSEPPTVIPLKSMNGKTVNVESRVDQKDLYNLSTEYSNRIESSVQLPYVNVNTVPHVKSMLADSKVTISGGYRGDNTHSGVGAENSVHKYGYGLDLKYDQQGKDFLSKVESNPELIKKYNILSISRHDNPTHVHIEFNPTTV